MTTNQTIDGVPRDLIEDALAIATTHATANWSAGVRDKLRALLDKEVSGDSRAPQHQGEPVAWIVTDMNGDSYFAYDRQTPNDKPLYAEQPAPVAVVMPSRLSWSGIASTKQRAEVNAWNACLDEVTRLNTK